MKPALILILLLAGCATRPVPVVVVSTPRSNCPESVPVPPPLVGKPTPAKIGALEIAVELAREKERDRGDCWRDAAQGVR